jgi:ribosome-associated toxin RatA of RatAB toxin-antitoxin module
VTQIHRSALVRYSPAQMFDLVNDVEAYPKRFAWCAASDVIEQDADAMTARLELRFAGMTQAFTTHNTLVRPERIDMHLVDGPFERLEGTWQFHALDESACKVTLTLDFEPKNKLLGPAFALGFQGLADRMVDDFVRAADRGAE